MIEIKRIYDPETNDGSYRVLVDRFWPRGISKEKANWDIWMKDIAPSLDLFRWFKHDPAKWDEFKIRYKMELAQKQNELNKLRQWESEHKTLTLLYAAKKEDRNNASVLRDFLMDKV